MLSDAAYNLLARRKGKRSFSDIVIELVEEKDAKGKDVKEIFAINGIIKTKKKVNWSTHADEILYGGKL